MGEDRPPEEGPEQRERPSTPESTPQAFPGSTPPERQGQYQVGKGPALREMGVGEILDATLKIYRNNWKTLLAIVAIVMVPYIFLQAIVVDITTPDFPDFDVRNPASLESFQQDVGFFGGTLGGALLTLILAFIITPFVTGAVAKATADIYLGGDPEVGSTYSFALSKLGSLLLVSILYGLAVIGGFILLIIPGIYFAVKFIFSTTTVVVEGRSGTDALKRSGALVKDYFWKVLGTYLLAAILVGIIGGLLGYIIGLGLGFLPDWLAGAVAQSITQVLTTPFLTMVIVLLYFDLRIRKEAFDLSLMAQELGQNPQL